MLVNSLGNLTLLPTEINSSVGNKGLQEKLLYYKCVGETDPGVLKDIENMVKSYGITLNQSTVDLPKNCTYSQHIKSVSALDYCDSWKADLVRKRTNAMLDIIYDKLISWIQ